MTLLTSARRENTVSLLADLARAVLAQRVQMNVPGAKLRASRVTREAAGSRVDHSGPTNCRGSSGRPLRARVQGLAECTRAVQATVVVLREGGDPHWAFGRVYVIDCTGSFGFIHSEDGRIVYFHRSTVLGVRLQGFAEGVEPAGTVGAHRAPDLECRGAVGCGSRGVTGSRMYEWPIG